MTKDDVLGLARNLETVKLDEALCALAARTLREQQMFIEGVIADAVRLQAENEALRKALDRIAALDPSVDSDQGWNEWGEADCFDKAQEIAKAALK
jgi:hypothetical protein